MAFWVDSTMEHIIFFAMSWHGEMVCIDVVQILAMMTCRKGSWCVCALISHWLVHYCLFTSSAVKLTLISVNHSSRFHTWSSARANNISLIIAMTSSTTLSSWSSKPSYKEWIEGSNLYHIAFAYCSATTVTTLKAIPQPNQQSQKSTDAARRWGGLRQGVVREMKRIEPSYHCYLSLAGTVDWRGHTHIRVHRAQYTLPPFSPFSTSCSSPRGGY